MSTLDLARSQFGITTLFHFIFVPMSIGLALLDAPLARRVIARVLAGAGSRGVLVITHSGESLEGFDKVLRLERGYLAAAPSASHKQGEVVTWS
jgi:hypothetical protein